MTAIVAFGERRFFLAGPQSLTCQALSNGREDVHGHILHLVPTRRMSIMYH